MGKRKRSNMAFIKYRGTPVGIQYFGQLEEHGYWGNEVKLYEYHVDALFAMFWRNKPHIRYYVCTNNKTFPRQGPRMVTPKIHPFLHMLPPLQGHRKSLPCSHRVSPLDAPSTTTEASPFGRCNALLLNS
uniref:Uncharacterized protein n=1 Tax=Triticum urartu TaxID=4572 RepID=A0A8R7R7D3_TRIUA